MKENENLRASYSLLLQTTVSFRPMDDNSVSFLLKRFSMHLTYRTTTETKAKMNLGIAEENTQIQK